MSQHHAAMPTPPATRLAALERDLWTCQNCGASVLTAALEVHHVKPLEDDGGNELSNLQTLCRNCHLRHHQKKRAANSPVYAERQKWARRIKEIVNHG